MSSPHIEMIQQNENKEIRNDTTPLSQIFPTKTIQNQNLTDRNGVESNYFNIDPIANFYSSNRATIESSSKSKKISFKIEQTNE